ncbi:MAG: ATP-binding protein [Chitinispirillia bacterium]|nr:ATP-binding protein [Chitinispirillia bacterium]
MGIRIRAILVIVITNLFIIMFSVFVGIGFVEQKMNISLETDLVAISNLADYYLSNELEILKMKVSEVADHLERSKEEEWPEILKQHSDLSLKFTGMAAFDASKGLIAVAGENPPDSSVMNDKYVKRSFSGGKNISSTCHTDAGVVFYLAVPISAGRIFVVTLPGMYFSERLSKFVIWETGHIFLSDAEGYVVSNPRDYWVRERFNYILAAKTDTAYTKLAETVTLMTRGKSGIGYYSVGGVDRTCAYRPISASTAGWSLGVVAPRPENPIKDTGNGLLVVGIVSIILNIVAAVVASNFIKKPFERIRALKEEADAANKAKSSFLSTMSHEIRTPMNAILGITEIQLQNEDLDTAVRDALERVYSSGDLLLSIINDILDLSKIEAGKLELSNDKYEIASLVSDTAQLNMMRIGSKPIEFGVNINENMPACMAGDELRVKQILNNLLSNAFKYTAAGKVMLTVTSQEAENADQIVLCICVSDTGQGMTKEQVSKLFDEYTRFNKEANRTTEGTGLGMSITRKLVLMMSGEFYVDSEPGKGTEFIVRLLQGRVGQAVLGREVAENLQQFRGIRSMSQMKRVQISREPMPYGKIMIVDDVETNIYVAKGLMIPYGLQIDSAISGMAAIEKVKAGDLYDIIFMDHMMPKMDGIEATKILREIGYDRPIVALTANAVAGQADVFLQNGFDDFISKPIDIRKLNLLLNKMIRDKQPPEVLEEARKAASAKKDRGQSSASRTRRSAASPHFTKIFVQDAKKSVAALEALVQKGGSYSEEDIQTYIIHTHGMKSALAYVGKMNLSEVALKLELLGRDNDTVAITAETPPFLESLRAVIEELSAEEESIAAVAVETRLSGKGVDGINIPEGLERYGGDENMYIDVLRSYVASVRTMLGAIENVSESDLSAYEIKVHGIKGVSREVFAPEIADAAYALEKAAATGDYAYVGSHNPEFLEAAWKLINDLDAMLATLDDNSAKPKKDKPDHDVLAKLCEACKLYDIDAADAAMAEIDKYQYTADDGLMDFLRANFAIMEFESIAGKLSSEV